MKKITLVVGLVWLFSCSIRGELIRQPPTLAVGEEYRLMFVTTSERDATSPDIDDYNRFVQSVADSSPLGAWGIEWHALASTSAVSARENIGYREDDPVPVFRVDGTEITIDQRVFGVPRTLFDGEIKAIKLSELGETIPFSGNYVWTGSEHDGARATPLGPSSATIATHGGAFSSGISAFNNGADSKVVPHHFFAVSEILTSVPEPGCRSLLLISTLCLLTWRPSRKRNPTYRTTSFSAGVSAKLMSAASPS